MNHEAVTTRTGQPVPVAHGRRTADERHLFQRMQAFEDAIDYRRARVAAPCADCATAGPGERCDDHARDLELIDGYAQEVSRSARALDALAAIRPPRPRLAPSA
jgi:hypothetical protein